MYCSCNRLHMSVTTYSSPAGLQMLAQSGTLSLTGQTLNVAGPTTFRNPVSLASTLSVLGPTTLTNSLTAPSINASKCFSEWHPQRWNVCRHNTLHSRQRILLWRCRFNTASAQSAQVSGLLSGGSLNAGTSTLGATTLSTCTVSGTALVNGLATMAGGISVTGGSSLQAVSVAGSMSVLSPATFSSSSPQILQVVGTSSQAAAFAEIVLDRSAAGQSNVGSVRFLPSSGLQLATNGTKSLTVAG